jgi:hypothetical protein
MFLTLIKPVPDKWVIEKFSRILPMRSCTAKRKVRCEGLIAVKIPPKDGVITSIFRRNYKVDLSYGVNIPLGEKDSLVLAGKFNDIKRFSVELEIFNNRSGIMAKKVKQAKLNSPVG